MDAFLAYIGEHWLEWLFAIVTGVIAFGYKNISHRLAEEREKNKAIAEGVQALLRENIVNSYNKYSDRGFCPIYAKESLKKAYMAYAALGGNSVAETLYKKILEMPEEREGHNES